MVSNPLNIFICILPPFFLRGCWDQVHPSRAGWGGGVPPIHQAPGPLYAMGSKLAPNQTNNKYPNTIKQLITACTPPMLCSPRVSVDAVIHSFFCKAPCPIEVVRLQISGGRFQISADPEIWGKLCDLYNTTNYRIFPADFF